MDELLASIANAARPASVLIKALDSLLERLEPLNDVDQK
jgi:hypothetical protein